MPDWDLMARIDELLAPYRTDDPDFDERIYSADDSRGTYDAVTVEELREEAAKQEEPPNALSVSLGAPGTYMNLRMYKGSTARAIIASEDEAVVNHVATRLRELFALAAIPKATTQIEGASFGRLEDEWSAAWPEPEPLRFDTNTAEMEFHLTDLAAAEERSSAWKQHAPSVITQVVSAVIGGLILAGILYLIFGNN